MDNSRKNVFLAIGWTFEWLSTGASVIYNIMKTILNIHSSANCHVGSVQLSFFRILFIKIIDIGACSGNKKENMVSIFANKRVV